MKQLKNLAFVFLSFLVLVAPASAQITGPAGSPCGVPGGPPCIAPGDKNQVFTLINKIFTFFLWIIITITTLYLLYAAFLYVTAKGDPEKANNAKQIIIYAVIGLVVAALAYTVPSIVQSILQ